MQREFQRVAIVNRGEPAMRFIHAVREFNEENGTCLRTIALFTEPDAHAMFVREADEAVSLGPAYIHDGDGRAKCSYVDYERLKQVLAGARAEAVWVGWGFVAEHAAFVDLCEQMGIVFIGPDARAMRLLGDKISSKRLAKEANVPTVPWIGPIETLAAARRYAKPLGYPLLIKATAGGGGHGIRCVRSARHLAEAFEGARSEAFKAFGDPTVFLEQLVPGARHVEVQVIADAHGTTWAVGVRDCTIQRRHQKILEEAPSPALSPDVEAALRNAAVRLSQAAGYRNAGTIEFLYDPKTHHFCFMEMNTRLQVEHPVTECTTDLDLVKLQIHIARGGRLEGEPPVTRGHAIEVRLNAEDPDTAFGPAPGKVERFRILTGPGVRIDTGLAEGDTVPPDFDSMIAKIIAKGRNRNEALSRLQRALRESTVVIKGGASNKGFLLELLSRPEVQSGEVDVGWLDRLSSNGDHLASRFADVALVQAAIEAYESELAVEKTQFYASALRGRPQVRSEIGRMVNLRYRGHAYALNVYRVGLGEFRVEVDDTCIEARLERLGPFECWLTIGGRRFSVVSVAQEVNYRIEVDGVSHRVDRDDGGFVHAPAPAVVVSVAVKPGDSVAVGDRLLVVESMKMEMQVTAPFSGKVRRVMAIPNVQVDTGTPLVEMESTARDQTAGAGQVFFGASFECRELDEAGAAENRELEQLRQLVLGFDVDAKRMARRAPTRPGEEIDEAICRENEILNMFVDICSLFQHDPDKSSTSGVEALSTEMQLFSYLRAVDTGGEGLPASFAGRLRCALAHYGVETLDPSPALEEALMRICKSHQRVDQQIAPIMTVLERRLEQADATHATEPFKALLDRMVTMSDGQFPAISDLARELRYRVFDQPVFEQARKKVYAQLENDLEYFSANPSAPDRAERVRAMVDCPQPVLSTFAGRLANANAEARQLMLEVLTARYYRVVQPSEPESLTCDGRCVVRTTYQDADKRVHLFTTHSEYAQLVDAARSLFALIEKVPPQEDIAIDFFVWNSTRLPEADATEKEIRRALTEAAFPRTIHRIVVATGCAGCKQGTAGLQVFTFRNGANGLEEEKLYRGVHPMIAKRLRLWRLSNFDVERLPSVEDVYLLHAVARENPKDERLFAIAEVRDVTPVKDEAGNIVHLPQLERMFCDAAAAIRLFQLRRRSNQRLHWNRILLYLWPPLSLREAELDRIVQSLTPATEGLGLEQVVVCVRIPHPKTGELRDMVVRFTSPVGSGLVMTVRPAIQQQPLKPLSDYEQKVVRMRQRGLLYPYEIIKLLTPAEEDRHTDFPPGEFVEYDLDAAGKLVVVDRPYGQNRTNIIFGVIRNFTAKYPEGMTRVLVLGDPSKDLGAIAEPECRRLIAALDLAEANRVSLEWFPISAGAKISMESGVENMDWIGRVLRRLVTFTQAGGEVNLVVNGINVGAQPYWNAEATMLMHTRGILIMTPKAAMVLTGKRALDYSGSVSAEDNQGIGGYDRIMGVNGQAQYWARDIEDACHILLCHYEHTYVIPGERFPRRAITTDPIDRDVQTYVHGRNGEDGFALIGEIMSDKSNPGRKKPFDIRRVMAAVIDQDRLPLERWAGMRAAETGVVWDAHLGGYPVCMIGIESRPVQRVGFVPADGPDQWSAGTLFPQSSKKIARAINAASNNRPVVVLANLAGFDGSPESMRRLQLEYGAEIGRAVVNFKGPMAFCVISRYHGGAYVVFSGVLNEGLEIAALEGTYASVIGGAPAAAVVFAGEVEARTRKDERLQALTQAIAQADAASKARLRSEYDELFKLIQSEKLGEMAAEFDRVHSVHRALAVGALHHIIPPASLRPYLIQAVERGIARETKPAVGGNGKAATEQLQVAASTMVA